MRLSFWDELEKIASLTGDLRLKAPGTNLTNSPTEDSKSMAYRQLSNSSGPGKFLNRTEAKHLISPGPSIKQIATIPR
jgi:hypothetical protein